MNGTCLTDCLFTCELPVWDKKPLLKTYRWSIQTIEQLPEFGRVCSETRGMPVAVNGRINVSLIGETVNMYVCMYVGGAE